MASLTASNAEDALKEADGYFVDGNYTDAIDQYALALTFLFDSSNNNNQYATAVNRFRSHTHRAAAFLQLNRYSEALEDMLVAHQMISQQQPSRTSAAGAAELLGKLRPGETEACEFRLGLAYFQLGQHRAAKEHFEAAKQLASLNHREEKKYNEYLSQCQEKIHPQHEGGAGPCAPTESPAAAPSSPKKRNEPTPPRYQYYQSDKFMTVCLLEANVQESDLHVDYGKQHLSISLRKGDKTFPVVAGVLSEEIDVENSKVNIKQEKVLVKLKKLKPEEWHDLLTKDSSKAAALPKPISKVETKVAPVQPYATRKDWTTIERQLKEEEEKEQPEGDEALNKLFSQIYSNADEDTRRAMIKSYQTSGGTVLSTNWDEVSKKDYEKERTAPDGQEWKNWEGDKLSQKKK